MSDTVTANTPCQCDKAGYCPRFNQTMTARMHRACRARPSYRWHLHGIPPEEWPEDITADRKLWVQTFAAQVPAPPRRQSLPTTITANCRHYGDLLTPCSCGNKALDVHDCQSNDTEWTRCWRSNNVSLDKDIGSCSRCLHRDEGPGDPMVPWRQALLAALAEPAPALTGAERGIVQCVGGELYSQLAFLSVQRLRQTGCELPIEWWHLGRHEFDPHMTERARHFGIHVVDASTVAAQLPKPPRRLNGWELKSFALLHSRFAEALLLDADNYVVRNPSYLFDDYRYQQAGAVFWPDLPPRDRRKWIPDEAWRLAGLPSQYYIRPLESGQILVDRRRCGRALQLTALLNSWSDVWYRLLYGDKDTFAVGWMLAKHDPRRPAVKPPRYDQPGVLPYAQPTAGPGFTHPCIIQFDLDGRPLFEHNTSGKRELLRGELVDNFSYPDGMAAALASTRELWPEGIWRWEDQSPTETSLAGGVCGQYLFFAAGGAPTRMTLAPGGGLSPLSDFERRWSFRIIDNVPTIVLVGYGHKDSGVATVFLQPDRDNRWFGWRTYGPRVPIEMARA